MSNVYNQTKNPQNKTMKHSFIVTITQETWTLLWEIVWEPFEIWSGYLQKSFNFISNLFKAINLRENVNTTEGELRDIGLAHAHAHYLIKCNNSRSCHQSDCWQITVCAVLSTCLMRGNMAESESSLNMNLSINSHSECEIEKIS